jgi:hypothetical protein
MSPQLLFILFNIFIFFLFGFAKKPDRTIFGRWPSPCPGGGPPAEKLTFTSIISSLFYTPISIFF